MDNFLSEINWEKIIDLIFSIDWFLIFKLILWIGIPYFLLWFSGFLYAFLKSKIWWDKGFFIFKIERQMKRGIPITYDKVWNKYVMDYKGFYFVRFIFNKRDNDCRIIVEGDRSWIWFNLFEDSEINLNLENIYDYNFYKKICNHREFVPPKKEADYTFPIFKKDK